MNRAMLFGWRVVAPEVERHRVKPEPIKISGIGAGQMSCVDQPTVV